MKIKQVRLAAAVVGLSTLVGSWLAGMGTAGAATPEVRMSAPKAIATLPAGCVANSAKVVNSPDGSYHGYLQATCDKHGRLFYISRNPAGQWALRSTTSDMPIVLAIAVDNTGTYFVGKRGNHDLVLVRRNGNGTLSGLHVLQKYDEENAVERATVTASNGNYWAVWDTNNYDAGLTDHGLSQARTIPPAIAPKSVGDALWYSPTLLTRSGKSLQLLGCVLSDDVRIDNPYASMFAATPAGSDWKATQQFDQTGCLQPGGGSDSTAAAYLHGHTYLANPDGTGIFDDRSGTFRLTTLTGMRLPEAMLGLTNTRAALVATSGSGSSTSEQVWLQNADGAFGAAPTEALPAAPVPVHADQIINRSGKLIRIFIQDDGHGHGGRRLLEQVQN